MPTLSKLNSTALRRLLVGAACCCSIAAAHAQSPCSLDVDGDGRVDALTDGLLILRAASGVTGLSLVRQAVSPNATRTDPDEILAFINSHQAADYDVDGDGYFEPDTDATIMIRYMFGLTDEAAIEDAVHPAGLRKSWPSIQAHLLKACDASLMEAMPAN